MLKLTSHRNIKLSIWVPVTGIVIEEGDGCSVIWVGSRSHLVRETAAQIMAMPEMVYEAFPPLFVRDVGLHSPPCSGQTGSNKSI